MLVYLVPGRGEAVGGLSLGSRPCLSLTRASDVITKIIALPYKISVTSLPHHLALDFVLLYNAQRLQLGPEHGDPP